MGRWDPGPCHVRAAMKAVSKVSYVYQFDLE